MRRTRQRYSTAVAGGRTVSGATTARDSDSHPDMTPSLPPADPMDHLPGCMSRSCPGSGSICRRQGAVAGRNSCRLARHDITVPGRSSGKTVGPPSCFRVVRRGECGLATAYGLSAERQPVVVGSSGRAGWTASDKRTCKSIWPRN